MVSSPGTLSCLSECWSFLVPILSVSQPGIRCTFGPLWGTGHHWTQDRAVNEMWSWLWMISQLLRVSWSCRARRGVSWILLPDHIGDSRRVTERMLVDLFLQRCILYYPETPTRRGARVAFCFPTSPLNISRIIGSFHYYCLFPQKCMHFFRITVTAQLPHLKTGITIVPTL